MRRSIAKIKESVQYYPCLMQENKFKVIPPPIVPAHIARPSYVDAASPIFGLYEGEPVLHGPEQIVKMRRAAKVACGTLEATETFILQCAATGREITEEDIDRFVFDHIVGQGAYPTPIGFMHFPKSVCLSANDCLVHGIPSLRPVQRGDKINIDVTAYIDGVHGDNNLTVVYGEALHPEVDQVIHHTQQAMYAAIAICKPGTPFAAIGETIETYAHQHGLHVSPFFTGHGVGEYLHLPPQVFHTKGGISDLMKVGNVFTIEPIITLRPAGMRDIQFWKDEFTLVSPNNPNAQFEHTILIVPGGCEVLTKRTNESIPNPNGNIF